MSTSTRIARFVLALAMFAVIAAPAAPAQAFSPAVEQWRELVSQYDWDVDSALAVIECESHGNPYVWNQMGSGAHGLFQLLGWERVAYQMFGVWDVADPEINTAVAYYIYHASGNRFSTGMGWAASKYCHGAW